MPRSQCEKENVQLVQELAEVDGPFESPINLNFRDLIKLELPSLNWNKPDAVPKKMKITNTGHTVIISGKWKSERPYLTGGPLDGKYVFSQIHFHWGPDNCKGSEHQVSGESFPLEMHVAHFKSEYMTQEAALREKDGMVVIVYLFKMQNEPNNSLKKIIQALPCIRQANTSQPMENRSILALCNPFTDDYFMYWGSVVTSTCAHILLWIVCREPFGISREQVEEFRKILDSSQHPIRRNSRETQPLHKRNVFHVNASRHVDEPMLPVKQIMGCFCDRSSVDYDRDDSHKSEGDGGCSCNANSGPQEELEGSRNIDCNQERRSNGTYMQQMVYYQHGTVPSMPTFPRDFTAPEVDESPREVSQSCCFLSIEEEKSVGDERQRPRYHRRKPIDSVTTLTNLIETLETLKIQTYKKLKEIESINHELRGMKSSCENLHEKHWLRHAEKIMSRQKRFTIRSSQCCFSDLKKLAKECNFDKLLDDKLISGGEDGKGLLYGVTDADSAFLCSNASGDKKELIGLHNINSRPLFNSEKFSRKAPKLIQSFFEDIKESDEAQANLEKNLILKKLSRRSSDQSNVSSLNIPHGHVHITKKMMNMGRIRNQFFTEIPSDEKAMPTSQTKLAPKKKKKKNRSFFKIRLGGFENEKPVAVKKVQKRSLFTRSALSWLNNRFSSTSESGPFISLRLRDDDLKSGKGSVKKKSKQSLKSMSIKKVSEERVRTEVSSYISESEISDKQSRYSKHIRVVQKSSERKSSLSLVKLIEDLDASKLFIEMGQVSSATSTDTERKFQQRRSRKDLWEKCSSGMFQKEDSKTEVKIEDVKDAETTESSSTLRQESCLSSKSVFERSKDVGVDAMDTQSVNSPRRKKLRLDGRRSFNNSEPENVCKTSYVESECQADLKISDECLTSKPEVSPVSKISLENGMPLPSNESQTETQETRDTSVEVNIPLPMLPEDASAKEPEKFMMSENEASEASLSPRKSSDTLSESKNFPPNNDCWASKLQKTEEQTKDLVTVSEPTKGEESSPTTDVDRSHQQEIILKCSELTYNLLSEESPDKKVQSDSARKESEITNIFKAEEMDKSVEVSRDASRNDLSECNEYDFQTDSNGTMIYNAEKEMQSRESTPSVQSSEDEKQQETASSIANIQQKPFSADSLRNANDGRNRKRRQCLRKKSKPLLRKSNAMIRKLNKIGGSNLDFTNLTEEEQLKIISANVAKFVKQKLVEHKQFFDFGKTDASNFDVEEWSKSAELELNEVTDDLEAERMWEKEVKEEVKQAEEEEAEEEEEVEVVVATAPTPPPVKNIRKEPVKPKLKATEKSPSGDTDKGDLRRQTLDFVKLNKIMAGKYKRKTTQDKSPGKNPVKREERKEPAKTREESPKTEIPKPVTPKQVPGSLIGRGVRAPSVDSARRNLQKGGKSDIPVLREPRARANARSSSASPTAATTAPKTTPTTSPLTLQKPKPPKKLMIPTYTLTSYLPAPSDVIQYQQRELDKYLNQPNITDFFLDEAKGTKYGSKKNRDLSKKNLDYLIMLQKRINHEISANIENSMNYVQTLLSQDYNGTAIIEKAPVKNSLDMSEPSTGGIVLIEMNDQFDCSSSSSEFSEESGFYCIYQGKNRRDNSANIKREIIIKRNESGDSGLVDSRIHDTDSNYSCEVSILVTPEDDQTGDVSDVLKRYIYHLGGGEEVESCYIPPRDDSVNVKPPLKKRRDRVLDLPLETKRKLLEDEMRELETGSEHTTDAEEDLTCKGDDLDNVEIISKISEMVKLYLNEYDRAQVTSEEEGQQSRPS